jgi:rhodanese-related sulfurtransferase
MNEEIKALRECTESAKKYFTQRLAYTLGPVELKNFMEKGGIKIIDVRLRADYEIGHIPNAISIPKSELTENFEKLSKDEVSIVYCYNQQCHLGENACLVLAEYGFPTMLLEGGYDVWANDFRFATTSSD